MGMCCLCRKEETAKQMEAELEEARRQANSMLTDMVWYGQTCCISNLRHITKYTVPLGQLSVRSRYQNVPKQKFLLTVAFRPGFLLECVATL